MVASMQRCSDTWKTTLSKGGKPQGYQPSSEISALAQKAARIVDADYCGVDVMAGEDGLLYILEVNGTPGWMGLQAVSDINIAELFVEYCLSKIA